MNDEDLCVNCLNELEYGEQICPECEENSDYGWTHKACIKKTSMDGLICIYAYEDEKVKKVISGIKFSFNQRLVPILVDSFHFEFGEKFDLIIPVPLYYYRENWRGFNQAELLARLISENLSIKYLNVLKRVKNTGQLSLVTEKHDRRNKILKAFKVQKKHKKDILGKRLLLIDDVFTSGATLKETAKELKKAGAKIVWGLVLAH